ncbi:TIR domain-containing protein [Lysinibacter cavernae]|uniref:TIR domain-containing protein n=1 Tax=Lysinibacter cavernae TaxID=1640652 RepID=UPI00361926C3
MAKLVYYSFHYGNDAWRVQQIVNLGLLQGQTILTPRDWETVKHHGDTGITNWIDKQMVHKSAVVVLIGSDTASRSWVKYEIEKAWNEKKPIVGIRIHALADSYGAIGLEGASPFTQVSLKHDETLADLVPVYTPWGATSTDIIADIAVNILNWVNSAYQRR